MNTSSNEIWINADNYDDFEMNRAILFRDDMREQFLKWFRIKPNHTVLDGGCGPGVLTRFIAKGLDTGKVTGFDISKNFVEYGNKKIAEQNLSDRAEIVLDDGFNLSFADNTFDVIVNHQYIGVLSDPVAGFKELIRVCKPGGTVSISGGGFGSGLGCDDDCAFESNARLKELRSKYDRIYKKIMTPSELKQSEYWHSNRYPKMLAECGLKNITIHAYSAAFSFSDSYWSDDFKIYHIQTGAKREIEGVGANFEEYSKFEEYGFSKQDCEELIQLYKEKEKYLMGKLHNNDDWEWNVRSHYIVAGTKVM